MSRAVVLSFITQWPLKQIQRHASNTVIFEIKHNGLRVLTTLFSNYSFSGKEHLDTSGHGTHYTTPAFKQLINVL